MTQSTRKSVLEGSRTVHDADVTMWKHIDHAGSDRDKEIKSWKRMANYAFSSILRGCRTLALPLFLGALIFQQVAIQAGFPVAKPHNLYADSKCQVLNTQVASLSLSQDDPFCLWISYPDVAPTSDVALWVHGAAADHISAGRVAILDHRWKRSFKEHSITDTLK